MRGPGRGPGARASGGMRRLPQHGGFVAFARRADARGRRNAGGIPNDPGAVAAAIAARGRGAASGARGPDARCCRGRPRTARKVGIPRGGRGARDGGDRLGGIPAARRRAPLGRARGARPGGGCDAAECERGAAPRDRGDPAQGTRRRPLGRGAGAPRGRCQESFEAARTIDARVGAVQTRLERGGLLAMEWPVAGGANRGNLR